MVENWEIVLADGSVVNANASSDADLWKAQKGGSGNLGFVTRIDQRKQLSLLLLLFFY
jgi:FAD/FMN-containing dehydrogenase